MATCRGVDCARRGWKEGTGEGAARHRQRGKVSVLALARNVNVNRWAAAASRGSEGRRFHRRQLARPGV